MLWILLGLLCILPGVVYIALRYFCGAAHKDNRVTKF